jgi:hypothetical protein
MAAIAGTLLVRVPAAMFKLERSKRRVRTYGFQAAS